MSLVNESDQFQVGVRKHGPPLAPDSFGCGSRLSPCGQYQLSESKRIERPTTELAENVRHRVLVELVGVWNAPAGDAEQGFRRLDKAHRPVMNDLLALRLPPKRSAERLHEPAQIR